ncbi:MAG: HEAT repeat domain-containing protein [Leptospiraceae bacterium]|nr:HEAT repeat domain-containing protein [Leptospiraceae bacterium]
MAAQKVKIVFTSILLVNLVFADLNNAQQPDIDTAIREENDSAVANFFTTEFSPNDKQYKSLFAFSAWPKNFQTRRKFILFLVKRAYYEDNAWREQFTFLCRKELKFLKDKHLHNREDVNSIRICVQTVGNARLRDMFYDIASFVAYPQLDVRKDTQETFSKFQDDRAFALVVGLMDSSNPLERVYAIDALDALKDERSIPVFIQALGDANKSVRLYAMKSLESLGRTEAHPTYIQMITDDPDSEVRTKAIEIIIQYRPRNAYQQLTKAISDHVPRVRRAAVQAIQQYTDASAAFYVSEQLAEETENDLKKMEIDAIIHFGTSGGMKGLNTIMANESDFSLKLWAIYAAGLVKDQRGHTALIQNLLHSDIRIRAETALSLGNLKNESSVQPLLNILKDSTENYYVRSAALFGLERINSNSSVNPLLEIMENIQNPFLKEQIRGTMQTMMNRRYK